LKVTILGLDHLTQFQDSEGRLEQLIREICRETNPDLVAEEWSTNRLSHEETVGKRVADGLGIPWCNVEMNDAHMADLDILDCVRLRRQRFDDIADRIIQDVSDTVYMPNADRLREEYWIQQIQNQRPQRGVLMLCGLIHVAPLAERMSRLGFAVEAVSLCEHEWYRIKFATKCAQVALNLKHDTC
jgi:hypothetical protein